MVLLEYAINNLYIHFDTICRSHVHRFAHFSGKRGDDRLKSLMMFWHMLLNIWQNILRWGILTGVDAHSENGIWVPYSNPLEINIRSKARQIISIRPGLKCKKMALGKGWKPSPMVKRVLPVFANSCGLDLPVHISDTFIKLS